MSFIGKWVGEVMKDLGLVDTPGAPPTPPAAPTMASAGEQMDAAAQKQAASMGGGRTSTMLNGADGVDDKKNTSKVLLGR